MNMIQCSQIACNCYRECGCCNCIFPLFFLGTGFRDDFSICFYVHVGHFVLPDEQLVAAQG